MKEDSKTGRDACAAKAEWNSEGKCRHTKTKAAKTNGRKQASCLSFMLGRQSGVKLSSWRRAKDELTKFVSKQTSASGHENP